MAIVYLLTNLENGKRYVGKTKHDLDRRWYNHIQDARGGSSYAIHAAIRKYGRESFNRAVLGEYTTEEEALLAEKKFIAKLGTFGENGYNMCEGGRGAIGFKHRPEAIAKLREASKGRKPSAIALQRSAEVRALGLSDKAKANLKAGQIRRRATQSITEEFRAKITEIIRARPSRGPVSTESNVKRSASLLLTWEKRKANGFVGTPLTEEHREKLAATTKAAWDSGKMSSRVAKPNCQDCGVEQTPENSSKSTKRSTGFDRRCRSCARTYMTNWRASSAG
jgi:group I intron endonuclease